MKVRKTTFCESSYVSSSHSGRIKQEALFMWTYTVSNNYGNVYGPSLVKILLNISTSKNATCVILRKDYFDVVNLLPMLGILSTFLRK